ncbi:hypothetical protein N8294_09355 [Polaribacter sp.]|nr:hypothetical protein [Polaribacter sp.]
MKLFNNILIEKTPDIIEFRAYLAQFIGWNDKRDFIQLSNDIENHINNEVTFDSDMFDFILNDIEFVKIKEVLKKFKILPGKIYKLKYLYVLDPTMPSAFKLFRA